MTDIDFPPSEKYQHRVRRGVLMASLLMAGWWGAIAPAQAQLWFYVDADGIAHFSSEKLDERYHRFSMSSLGPNDVPLDVPRPEPVQGQSQDDGMSEHDRKRLQFFVEQNSGYQRHALHIRTAAQKHGVDEALLKAVATAESGFNPLAVSPKGAIGLMQVIPATAERFGVSSDKKRSVEQKLKDPSINVPVGARYLRYLQAMFPERTDLVLAAYNAGEGAVQRYGNKIPPYKETQNYVKTVMALYKSLKPTQTTAMLGDAQLSGSLTDGSRLRMTIPTATWSITHY